MRLVSFLASLVVLVSFPLVWLRPPSGDVTFLGILGRVLLPQEGFEGAFWWLNPSSTGSIFTFVVFFAGIFMILLGVLFGILGGRLGPGLGIFGMLIFTLVVWHFYGNDLPNIIGEGYLLALGGFLAGVMFGGGRYL
ncbi:hypothetical protein CL1_0548 [Thermococcus cleftensis]|uniref:Uncharacterized protein n=1 Tax=Thermococcus cleftensis (strain DSM 27260 / KACC 17922 / CL1) TaxID=163003 RepID=I3ZSS2_THECF|nr:MULTISPECIES: hypothetical protein [Thermococcus]AFL94756.1 hypothetical protein CL1_0548 [Thermococcus cleftensis]NJE03555.1 amino acid permease [Thermococcus sp. MV11]